MRGLSAFLGLALVTAVVVLFARERPGEAERIAKCENLERRLAVFEQHDPDSPEARGATKSALEALVSSCRENGHLPAG